MVLLLISPHFLHSADCYEEVLLKSLQQQQRSLAKLIPILLRPVDWPATPLADLTYLPRSGKAITQYEQKDAAFSAIASEIRVVIASLQQISEQRLKPPFFEEKRGRVSEDELFEVRGTIVASRLVAIIDDALTVRKTLETQLRHQGIATVSFSDGFEALRWLQSTGKIPDLFVLDVGLPKMDGYEIARHLKAKENFKKTIIIILSSRDGVIDRLKGRLSDAVEYITKPFRYPEVVLCILRYLAYIPAHDKVV
ncbi:MAG TPA: response regulator [Ktedonobacteraceae bacterium]|nr:response regulator [Ktedonobacteraceae bacterium]